MKDDAPGSRSSTDSTVEYYVPATFQFSTEPGRIERILVGLFRDRSTLEARIAVEEPVKEFYVPAMYQFSTEPGRIERFLDSLLSERGEQEFRTVPEEFLGDFYLPAVDPDEYRRRDERERAEAPLAPAPEVLSGRSKSPK